MNEKSGSAQFAAADFDKDDEPIIQVIIGAEGMTLWLSDEIKVDNPKHRDFVASAMDQAKTELMLMLPGI